MVSIGRDAGYDAKRNSYLGLGPPPKVLPSPPLAYRTGKAPPPGDDAAFDAKVEQRLRPSGEIARAPFDGASSFDDDVEREVARLEAQLASLGSVHQAPASAAPVEEREWHAASPVPQDGARNTPALPHHGYRSEDAVTSFYAPPERREPPRSTDLAPHSAAPQPTSHAKGRGLRDMWGAGDSEPLLSSGNPAQRHGPGLSHLWDGSAGADAAAAARDQRAAQATYHQALDEQVAQRREQERQLQQQQQQQQQGRSSFGTPPPLGQYQQQQQPWEAPHQQPQRLARSLVNNTSWGTAAAMSSNYDPATRTPPVRSGNVTPISSGPAGTSRGYSGASPSPDAERAAASARKAAYAEELRRQMQENRERKAREKAELEGGIPGARPAAADAAPAFGVGAPHNTPGTASSTAGGFNGTVSPYQDGYAYGGSDGSSGVMPEGQMAMAPQQMLRSWNGAAAGGSSGGGASSGDLPPSQPRTAARRRLVEDVYGGNAVGGVLNFGHSAPLPAYRAAAAASPGAAAEGSAEAAAAAGGEQGQGQGHARRAFHSHDPEVQAASARKKAAAVEQQRALQQQIEDKRRAKEAEEARAKADEDAYNDKLEAERRAAEAEAEAERQQRQRDEQDQLERLYRQQEAALAKKRRSSGGPGPSNANGAVDQRSPPRYAAANDAVAGTARRLTVGAPSPAASGRNGYSRSSYPAPGAASPGILREEPRLISQDDDDDAAGGENAAVAFGRSSAPPRTLSPPARRADLFGASAAAEELEDADAASAWAEQVRASRLSRQKAAQEAAAAAAEVAAVAGRPSQHRAAGSANGGGGRQHRRNDGGVATTQTRIFGEVSPKQPSVRGAAARRRQRGGGGGSSATSPVAERRGVPQNGLQQSASGALGSGATPWEGSLAGSSALMPQSRGSGIFADDVDAFVASWQERHQADRRRRGGNGAGAASDADDPAARWAASNGNNRRGRGSVDGRNASSANSAVAGLPSNPATAANRPSSEQRRPLLSAASNYDVGRDDELEDSLAASSRLTRARVAGLAASSGVRQRNRTDSPDVDERSLTSESLLMYLSDPGSGSEGGQSALGNGIGVFGVSPRGNGSRPASQPFAPRRIVDEGREAPQEAASPLSRLVDAHPDIIGGFSAAAEDHHNGASSDIMAGEDALAASAAAAADDAYLESDALDEVVAAGAGLSELDIGSQSARDEAGGGSERFRVMVPSQEEMSEMLDDNNGGGGSGVEEGRRMPRATWEGNGLAKTMTPPVWARDP